LPQPTPNSTPSPVLSTEPARQSAAISAPEHNPLARAPGALGPMLDVHPPHEVTHTWKDFFIHIATIVVGLLIAIGLEQSEMSQ
jgi:hypothetical protein